MTELEHNVVQDIPHRLCFVGSGVFDGPGRVDDLATEPDVGVCSQLGLVQRFRDEPHPLHSSAVFVYCGDCFFVGGVAAWGSSTTQHVLRMTRPHGTKKHASLDILLSLLQPTKTIATTD